MNKMTVSDHAQQKQKILFAHSAGGQGSPGEGSFDLVKSLQEALGDRYELLYPIVSQPHELSYAHWKTLLDQEFKKITTDVMLIGHSLGGSMLLKYLSEEKTAVRITSVFMVAIPQWSPDGWAAEEFSLKPGYAKKLPPVAHLVFYHCTDDPIVPVQHLNFYKKSLPHAIFRELPCGDHAFANGLPELVNDITL